MTFGRALLPLWPLDPGATYLNHGTVGVTPRRVLEAQQRLRDRIERHPSKFLLRELWTFAGDAPPEPILMRRAAAEVAAFVGANAADLVFVDNTTAGVNAVMQSLRLSAGDDVVITDRPTAASSRRSGTGRRGPARSCEWRSCRIRDSIRRQRWRGSPKQ